MDEPPIFQRQSTGSHLNCCVPTNLTRAAYVRKSIGNAIRDISKKHSNLVSAELSIWILSSKEIHRFINWQANF